MDVNELIAKLANARDIAQASRRPCYVAYPVTTEGREFVLGAYPYADDVRIRVMPNGTAEFVCESGRSDRREASGETSATETGETPSDSRCGIRP